jgi:hypothetical protein
MRTVRRLNDDGARHDPEWHGAPRDGGQVTMHHEDDQDP